MDFSLFSDFWDIETQYRIAKIRKLNKKNEARKNNCLNSGKYCLIKSKGTLRIADVITLTNTPLFKR